MIKNLFNHLSFLLFFFLCCSFHGINDLQTERLFREVFERHLTLLNHLEISQPPLLVMFSATPGMGKTTVAKELEERLQAVRISSDEVRNLWREKGVNPSQPLLIEYLHYCVFQIVSCYPNHFLILDMSIDRNYSYVTSSPKPLRFNTYIIRLLVPKETVIERIMQRESDPEKYLKNLDQWFSDYENFNLNLVDCFLDNSQPLKNLDWDFLIDSINHLKTTYRND